MHNFFINPYDLNIYFQYETNKHLNLTLNKYLTKTPNENEIMQFMDKAIKIIDNDKSISMLEEHTPYFAGKGYNKISFFPIGLSQSDYLITSYQFAKIKDGELIYNTFIKDNFKVEKGRNCIKNSIKKNYKKVLESKEISK